VTLKNINGWHAARGFARLVKWRQIHNSHLSSIGYHFVISASGLVSTGRHIDEIGAHAKGFNANSIGICMVGLDAFSQAQWDELKKLVEQLLGKYPEARVAGHCELNKLKTCPNFFVPKWMEGKRAALADHLYTPKEKANA